MPVPVGEERGNGVILSHQFTNIDCLTEQVQPFFKGQLTQLSVEGLHCDLRLAALSDVQFVFAKSSCPISLIGEKRRDAILFCCLLEMTGPCLISHCRKVSHHSLHGFDPNLEAKAVLPANMQYVSVQIKRDFLQNYLTLMARPDLNERFFASNYVHVPETISTVKTYLWQLLHLLQYKPHFLQRSDTQNLLIEDFVPLLIHAIPLATKDILQPPSAVARAQLVKQAEEYMLAHLEQPLTLKGLCKALHTSPTPVFVGFREAFGTSPMEYLKAQRLLSVRRSLKAAAPETTSVVEIARKYGFWSGGHFSRDYKQMFGELPSETLKQT